MSTSKPGYALSALDDPEPELARLRQQAEVIQRWEQQQWDRAGLPDAGRILEIGCGPGFVLQRLRSPGTRLLGVDLEQDSLHRIEDDVGRLRADAHHLPLADGCVDAVLLRFALFYIPRPGGVLREVRRVLRRGGRVLVQETDLPHILLDPEPELWPALIAARGRTIARRGGSIWLARRLRSLLAEAGLEGVRLDGLAVTTRQLSPPVFARMILLPAALDIDGEDMAPDQVARAGRSLERWGRQDDACGACLVLMGTANKP
jgi:ubiquinone/menaquinone biosynthesis C-methylase UbiE